MTKLDATNSSAHLPRSKHDICTPYFSVCNMPFQKLDKSQINARNKRQAMARAAQKRAKVGDSS